MISYPLVNSFVMPTDHHQVVFQRKAIGHLLIECFAIRSKVDDIVVLCIFQKALNCIYKRLCHHYHSCAATKRIIIHLCPGISGVISQIDDVYLQQSLFLCTFHNRVRKRRSEQIRYYGDDIYRHGLLLIFVNGGLMV